VTDTIAYLSAIGGNSLTEFDGISSFFALSQKNRAMPVDTFALGIIESNHPAWLIEAGYENRATADNSYFIIQSKSDDAEIFYKGRKKGPYYSSERRSLKLKGGNWNVTLGNYTADIGAGLSIGRYDYRPVSSPDDESDFIFPDNSYYNGLKIEYFNKAKILYSAKKYTNLFKACYGAAVSTDIRAFNIGISSCVGHFSAGGHKRNLGVGSVYMAYGPRRFRMEAAYAKSGMGLFTESVLNSFNLKGWHYSDSYLNPQSSGYAYPDYKTYEILDNFRFRQAQAGESGLYIGRIAQLKKTIIRSAIESWIVSKASVDISFSAQYPINDNLYLKTGLSGRGGAIKDRYQYDIELAWYRLAEIKGLSSVKVISSQIDQHNSFSQFYMMLPVGVTTLVGGRVKFRYDSNLEFFLEEKTIIDDNVNVKATYRWRETDGPRLGPFYLVAECVL
jgi:hypothetical protein